MNSLIEPFRPEIGRSVRINDQDSFYVMCLLLCCGNGSPRKREDQ